MKHILKFNESSNNRIPFDSNKYVTVWEKDIIPDTKFGIYEDFDGKKFLFTKEGKDKLRMSDGWYFLGIAVTADYYGKYLKAKQEYEELSNEVSSVQGEDPDYYEPNLYYLHEEYSKYYKKGNWSDLYWDFSLQD